MQIVNARAALLSNFEVLSLLQDLESDHIFRTKALQKLKKEQEASGESIPGNTGSVLETSENLRTIEVEAIQCLTAEHLPTIRQTTESITNLVKKLEPFDLTKAEKLQIVNLMPTTAVELYVIVEELEDRFGERMDELLQSIQDIASNSSSTTTENAVNGADWAIDPQLTEKSWSNPAEVFAGDDDDAVYDEEMYDDTGAGAGVEGDLEAGEDD
ncbi:hypothetical protein FA15DRAFT_613497 [Coprinopsis marcescibilis]|uniref:DNA-directed RNA polymerase III subunit RPC9 n=1 Tax=Coprinopsis marcescibilis TaxID=230819 RepID=A0A5C3LGM0_COPMA|nr:hypothetical protein FA15DRAFT_613497 [Coprinopsis marcescibilis]